MPYCLDNQRSNKSKRIEVTDVENVTVELSPRNNCTDEIHVCMKKPSKTEFPA
jgi:hypothetical protein